MSMRQHVTRDLNAAPMRLLIANDPRSYRDVLVGAVRLARPAVDIREVNPVDIAAEAARYTPDLIICSDMPADVDGTSCDWVLLSPDGRSSVRTMIAGRHELLPYLEFRDLVALIDTVLAGLQRE